MIINVNLKVQPSDSSCTRYKNHFFMRYIARKKSGTPIMKVAASGETPKISATKSLIAPIIYLSYLFTQLLNASFAALSVLAFRTWGD